jgi:hypothetical protein
LVIIVEEYLTVDSVAKRPFRLVFLSLELEARVGVGRSEVYVLLRKGHLLLLCTVLFPDLI